MKVQLQYSYLQHATKSSFVYSAQWCFSKWARLILAVMISLGSAQAEQLALKAMRILNKFMHCCCLLSICYFYFFFQIHALLMGQCLARRTNILREWRRHKSWLIMEWGERVALVLESTQTMLRSGVAQIQIQLFEMTVWHASTREEKCCGKNGISPNCSLPRH